MKNSDILLSICIPTFNRAKALKGNLDALFQQSMGKNLPLEFMISDNCSTDDTAKVVNSFIEKGMSINYIRNQKNLGMDGNFAQCYRKASGKYVLVLGDDDFLNEGMLEKLLIKLRSGDYGLVHLKTNAKNKISDEIFYDTTMFLKNISFWITYISSNVVNSKYIRDHDFEKKFGSYLTIIPLYLTAAVEHKKNLLINERVFSDGIDSKTNGGYNFFEVFIVNYLGIWKDFKDENKISKQLYKWIKRDILKFFLIRNAYTLLIKKDKNNYKLENSFSYFKNFYFSHLYFYYYFTLYVIKHNLNFFLVCLGFKIK